MRRNGVAAAFGLLQLIAIPGPTISGTSAERWRQLLKQRRWWAFGWCGGGSLLSWCTCTCKSLHYSCSGFVSRWLSHSETLRRRPPQLCGTRWRGSGESDKFPPPRHRVILYLRWCDWGFRRFGNLQTGCYIEFHSLVDCIWRKTGPEGEGNSTWR